MPLPGGPSDKLGNRYELRWAVRQLVDLVTGRLDCVRIEPPGEDGIDFRCSSRDGHFAYQIKRGVSGVGHWTLAALGGVLENFGDLLAADAGLMCVFASAHNAPELLELSERARASRNSTEFAKHFLRAKWLAAACSDLKARWRASDVEMWRYLQRVSVLVVSEQVLIEYTDSILRLLFDAEPEVTRAVLTDLALESVHVELRAADVNARLLGRLIRRTATNTATGVAPATSPPPPAGAPRDAELEHLSGLVASGKSTVIISGISGIGKSTVAAQYAALRGGPTCWIDCSLVATGAEALATISEFVVASFHERAIADLVPRAESQAPAVARVTGRVLAANKCLLVWDGLDGERRDTLGPVVDAIATTIGTGGTQVVTAQEVRASGRAVTLANMRVDRLTKSTVARLLSEAFANALTSEIEAADEATQGHPYLLQLLVDASSVIDLKTAIESLRSENRAEGLLKTLIGELSEETRVLLPSLAWLGIPFEPRHVEGLGGRPSALMDLAARHLVVRSSGSSYRVHELVARMIQDTTAEGERAIIHERASLMLRNLGEPSWLEVRATLRHAKAASLHEVSKEAGTALLRYAMDHALWGLAREAAEGLVEHWHEFYPYFVLGKCLRMTGELEGALASYEEAEKHAPDASAREVSRYERASVLCELGRREEAEVHFSELLNSSDLRTRVFVRVALATGHSDRGETESARDMLGEALEQAVRTSDRRMQAEVHHAIAKTHVADESWELARVHAKEAHALRFSLQGPEATDVLGWFHLYVTALLIERALGNRDAARSAAHGLWQFALRSGSMSSEARAAYALCLADPNTDDPEVHAALVRVRAAAADRELPAVLRAEVLESLALCEWSLGHHEESVEAILCMVALSSERGIEVPIIGHLARSEGAGESVVRTPFGYGLLMPPGEGEEFISRLVSRVLLRRPDLARHARLTVAEQASSAARRKARPKVSKARSNHKRKC